MRKGMNRRTVVGGLAASLSAACLPRRACRAAGAGTRLILLGTGGGPRPRASSSAPAQVIVTNDASYVVDCGDGVARQLVLAGVPLPGVDRLVARVPNASTLKKRILSHHTTAEDAGRVASAAGVKQLVLSHLVPPDDPQITEEQWLAAARQHFSGPVILGKDLLEVPPI